MNNIKNNIFKKFLNYILKNKLIKLGFNYNYYKINNNNYDNIIINETNKYYFRKIKIFKYKCNSIIKGKDIYKKIEYRLISINNISHTLAKGNVRNYKITTCSGIKSNWLGLGTHSSNNFYNSMYLSKYLSINNIYVINLKNYIYNNYIFKFKGCKIELFSVIRNIFKLTKIISSVQYLLGKNCFNIKLFKSRNKNIIIKLLLSSLTKI
uniref:Ribosomal protein S5 n=1 Tax=Babesia rodhaini TaxID=5870 RepID=A0A455R4T5_BABRO|nr:ribosomal protein S5 [Babesia rodhaini]